MVGEQQPTGIPVGWLSQPFSFHSEGLPPRHLNIDSGGNLFLSNVCKIPSSASVVPIGSHEFHSKPQEGPLHFH